MDRLKNKFIELKNNSRKALSCYITSGYPDIVVTEKLIYCLEETGADIIELGIPFSDPMADGPVIQESSTKALETGISLGQVLGLVKKVRQNVKIPIVLMSYFNPVYKFGLRHFFSEAKECGVDGLIIPDIIPEEGKEAGELSARYKIPLIYFISPNTPPQRQAMILHKSKGFIYVVSVTGVTGERNKFSNELKIFLSKLRKKSAKPLMLGFGISNPQQLKDIKNYIDGVIIGSALIKVIKNSKKAQLDANVRQFLLPFRKELNSME